MTNYDRIKWSILKIVNQQAFVLQEIHLIFNMILINHKHYKYLECDVIKYLYKNNKIKYYDIGLHISKCLKDGIETPKEKMQEIDYQQSIYIVYKGNNITITDIDANNKNEIIIFITSDVSGYSDNPLVTNNNSNNKYKKTITIEYIIVDQEREK